MAPCCSSPLAFIDNGIPIQVVAGLLPALLTSRASYTAIGCSILAFFEERIQVGSMLLLQLGGEDADG